MTADTAYAPPPNDESADKALALVSYVVLFVAPFVAGFPSLISVIIAYVRRGAASPVLRTHYDFQIKIFWIGCALMVATANRPSTATGLGLAWSAWGDLPATVFSFGVGTVLMIVLAGGAFLANFLWMLIASVLGFVRLLEGQPIGRVRTPASGLPTAA
jgi:uncharacterized membrane protein